MTSGQNTGTTLISVRAEARHEVQPDYVRVYTTLSTVARDKTAAHDAAVAALHAVTDDLAALGGLVRTADTRRHPLVWTAGAIRTHAGGKRDESGARQRRHRSTLDLRIVVRDFALLERIDRITTSHEAMSMDYASWGVDDDNAGWPIVRAAAIEAALRKGQDYAVALGGEILAVEQIADAGLLGETEGHHMKAASRVFVAQSDDVESDSRSLDPEPQRLEATIDARFVASTGALPVR